MQKVYKVVFCLSLLIISYKPGFAWGPQGHEMIAKIAWHFLDDSTKKIVQEYLGKMSIEEASNWMDDAKSNSYFNFMRTWHYINMDKGATYKASSERNIVTVLHSAILDARNYKTASKKDIHRDLMLIFHLIGDIHQPMHAGYGIDRGGNSIEINSPVASGNLHSTWDGQIIDFKHITMDSVLAIYDQSDKVLSTRAHNMSVLTWMTESRQYLDSAYNMGENNYLSIDYMNRNAEIIKKRLLVGGMRLAILLKDIFNPDPVVAKKN